MFDPDDTERAKRDQEFAKMRDVIPPMWWAIYTGLMDVGFPPSDAMDLLKCYIVTLMGGKFFLPPSNNPDPRKSNNE